LRGLKENVIIGRLIPAGSGFAGSRKHNIVLHAHDEVVDEDDEPHDAE
jgi:hypothetical protein